MNLVRVKVPHLLRMLFIFTISLTIVASGEFTPAVYKYQQGYPSDIEFVAFDHTRQRRDVGTSTLSSPTAIANASSAATSSNSTASTVARVNNTEVEKTSASPSAGVPKTPLLGVNGSGILHVDTPKVSDPIAPDDDTNDVFKETPETIKAEHNLENVIYDNHIFYNTTFIGALDYFQEYWNNITQPKAEIHDILSNSHRRATTVKIKFPFPFYGHPVTNMTVATGGFIYMGEHVHNWLAATQYIAPLMGNFDTSVTEDGFVKMYGNDERFTVFWENVTLRQDMEKKFTFAVTLYKNGDIIFAYKDIPIPLKNIADAEHPVKVGISDAYLTDKLQFHVRRKTISEYHRITFKNYEIASNTIMKMIALPTCLQYNSCQSCTNHETGFDCLWCDKIKMCSSGTDRNKQDWILRQCDASAVANDTFCPMTIHVDAPDGSGKIVYTTDTKPISTHDTVIVTNGTKISEPDAKATIAAKKSETKDVDDNSSPVGGVVAAFVAIALVCSLVAWVFYAFKNPHTRSGQLLIKYRPSTWSWRRGEARYTAATIHM